MNYSEEQLNEITQHAANLLKPSEICIVMGIKKEFFMAQLKDLDSQVHKAYYKGYLLTKSEINHSVITLAKSGSSPAQTMAGKFISDIESEKYD